MCGLALGTFSPMVTGAMAVCSPLFSPLWLWMTGEFLLYFDLLLTSKLSDMILAGCVEHSSVFATCALGRLFGKLNIFELTSHW